MAELTRSTGQLGAVIRRARKAKGLNQAELAERSGTRQPSISMLENGKPTARIETLMSVLAALDLEMMIDTRSKGAAQSFEDIF